MNYLEGRAAYLGGPIEYDTGEDWRSPVKKVLSERFKLCVFDPSLDPKQNQIADLRRMRQEGNYDQLSEVAHEFVRADLGVIDNATFLIAYLPYKVPVFGTVHEIVSANNAKKPTLLVCPEGKDKITTWAFGFIRHEFMFGSWDTLYDYLQEVADGKHKKNNRWYLMYHYYQENGASQWKYRE